MASFKQYTASGGASEAFSIKTFSSDEIKVYVAGVLKTSPTHYTITSYTVNGGTVTWTSGNIPSSGTVVRIIRDTKILNNAGNAVEGRATYSAGSSVKSDDLNDNHTQALRSLEEQDDQLIQTYDIENLAITSDKIAPESIVGAAIVDDAIDSRHYVDASIDTIHLSANCVTSAKIADNAINTADINDSAVTTVKIADANVTTAKIADSAITGAKITGDAITGAKIADEAINSEHYVDGSVGTVHIADNAITSAKIAGGAVSTSDIADVAVTTAKIADSNVTTTKLATNAVTTVKITDGTITTAKLASGLITTDKLGNDSVTNAKIADDQIDSEHYVDGSIDTAHLANSAVTTAKINNDAITGAKIADDAIDSEHYTDGSIDAAHIASNAVTTAKILDANVTMAKLDTSAVTLPGNISVTNSNLDPDAVRTAAIKDANVTTAKIADNAVTADKIADSVIVTASEQAAHSVNDASFFTTSAAEARFFNASTGETIKDGQSFPDNDTTIATTAAINDRIIDLVDDVGGFVPIANETSFPNANPDVNNGTGTLVSIKALASNLTSNGSGVATIANGTVGNSTVTINGLAASTTYAANFGMIVETTTTLNTYTFHRQVPIATEVSTVAGSISNVNTVAGDISNVNAVAGNATNINAVAADATDIGAVAGKATEIGRLGTADAVADMAILGTTDVVADLNTLGTADIVSDMNTLAVSGVISDMDTCATNVSNINTVGGAIANVNTTAGSIANVNTVATNMSGVNDFAARYRAATNNAGEYSSNNDAGDLYFNTDINALKVWNGSAWITGVTDTGDYAVTTGNTFTGNNDHNDSVKVRFGTSDDLEIYHDGTNSRLDNSTGQLCLNSDEFGVANAAYTENIIRGTANGAVKLFYDNANKLETTSTGVSVTGVITTDSGGATTTIDIVSDTESSVIFTDHGGSAKQYKIGTNISSNDGQLEFKDLTAGAKRLEITSGGNVRVPDNGKFVAGAGDDLKIYHASDASVNKIESGTNTLYIGADHVQLTNGAITEAYVKGVANGSVELYYDGVKQFETLSNGVRLMNGHLQLNQADSMKAIFGASDDLQIYHDGNHSYINDAGSGLLKLVTSGFQVRNAADDETLIYAVQDGAVNLYYDNAKKFETSSAGTLTQGDATITDAVYLSNTSTISSRLTLNSENGSSWQGTRELVAFDLIGNGADHRTGNLSIKIKKAASDSDPTEMMRIDGTYNKIRIPDSVQLELGDGGDLQIYHSGSHSYILNGTGNFDIRSNNEFGIYNYAGDEVLGKFIANGAVELRYDNSKKFETDASGVKVSNGRFYSAGTFAYIESSDTSNATLTLKKTAGGADSIDYLQLRDSSNNVKLSISGSGDIDIEDDAKLKLGTGDDLQIYHDGSHSYIKDAGTGHLYQCASTLNIMNAAGNAYLGHFAEGGEVALFYDNSNKFQTTAHGVNVTGSLWTDGIYMDDNHKIHVGTSGTDLQIYHDGSHSRIHNGTGQLQITTDVFRVNNAANDEIQIKADANGAVELMYDSSKKLETFANGIKLYDTQGDLIGEGFDGGFNFTSLVLVNELRLQDNEKIKVGLGDDLQIYHNGTNSLIENGTGELLLRAKAGENSINCNPDGSVELFHDNNKRFETTSGGAKIGSGMHLAFGNSEEFKIHYDGSTNHIDSVSANLEINHGGEKFAAFAQDAQAELYYDGSKQVETVSGGLHFADSKHAEFGNSGDLKIYHDGTNSIVKNDTATLLFRTNYFNVSNNADTERQIYSENGGGVHLYYDNAEKLYTESGGIRWTGRAGNVAAIGSENVLSCQNSNGAKVAYFRHDHDSNYACIDCQSAHATGGQSAIMLEFRRSDGQSKGGIFTSTSATSYNTSSDYRLKENQVLISDGITRLKTLKPYRFNWKENPDVTVDGFFAHEVTAVPESIIGTKDEVDANNDPVYQTIDHSKLVPLLTGALQEAIAKIEVLETKVAALESS